MRSATHVKCPPKNAERSAAVSPKSPPDWATAEVFRATRSAVWRGATSLAGAFSLFPDPNPTFVLLQGLPKKDWIQRVHPVDRKRVASHFAKLDESFLPTALDYRLLGNTGEPHWVRHRTVRLEESSGQLIACGFIQDIQAEKDFQMESLSVSEREQNRIGQDLHDDLCQVLAGVSCLMKVAEYRIAQIAPSEVSGLQEINAQIVEAMSRTRALTHGLFPGKIQITDIRGAMLELVSQIRARFGITIHAEFAGRFPAHSSTQIIQVFRIAQESVSNAIRHGRASEVVIRLESLQDTMRLTICDNGSGLPKGAASNPGGVGIHIMHYRASILGGSLSLSNVERGGVCVCLSYPFAN